MQKFFILAITIIIIGVGLGFLALFSYFEILDSIEYFKTLPAGSSQPGIDYETLYFRTILCVVLIIAGFSLLYKHRPKMGNSV
jgi:uncharacterized BrkB/YihY/UPF0761 family membrane protein